jgi:hypothetical protein
MIAFDTVVGFDWEAEEVFLHCPLVLALDLAHSSKEEPRFHALGVTRAGRRLHLTFTIRGNGTLIRVISARDMHRKERVIYDKAD